MEIRMAKLEQQVQDLKESNTIAHDALFIKLDEAMIFQRSLPSKWEEYAENYR